MVRQSSATVMIRASATSSIAFPITLRCWDVYKERQRNAVIDTVLKGYPLNVIYWVEREDGGYEVMDGQQRTISICQFFNNDFSYNMRYFHNGIGGCRLPWTDIVRTLSSLVLSVWP